MIRRNKVLSKNKNKILKFQVELYKYFNCIIYYFIFKYTVQLNI